MSILPYKHLDTIRTVCGKGRITYDPAGHIMSPSNEEMLSDPKPWSAFWKGSAELRFATIIEANEWFKTRRQTRLIPSELKGT